jgi:hypothetical protein
MKSCCLLFTAAFATCVPACLPASAQWFNYPSKGLPRTADGKPDLTAPAPHTPDGKPDLSGIWMPPSGYVFSIATGTKPEDIPFQPWAAELYKKRRENLSKEDPVGHCIMAGVPRADNVPYPFKILNSAGEMAILYEAVHGFRQIFLDGRALPKDPQPTWMGYSIGHWDGDTLAIETTGFNDQGWLDNDGRPATDALHVTERFKRKDVGHLDLEITIDDPKAYTKPWVVKESFKLLPDTELLEYVCNENNKDLSHLVGK